MTTATMTDAQWEAALAECKEILALLKSSAPAATALDVYVQWDDKAKVWCGLSEAIPGLIVEADTLEKLIAETALLAPELCQLNGVTVRRPAVIRFMATRTVPLDNDDRELNF